MATALRDRVDALRAYPTISAAAKMLGVSASTLSRREDLVSEARGERDKVIRPRELMRLALVHRKRSLNEVAASLMAHARATAPETVDSVEEEIEAFVSELEEPSPEVDQLLELAERHLPEHVVRQIRRATEAGRGSRAAPLAGGHPA
jgi:DNA-binding transcriptional MerR regulator